MGWFPPTRFKDYYVLDDSKRGVYKQSQKPGFFEQGWLGFDLIKILENCRCPE